ncbi:MAG: twin-arginine translocase subunit TatB [Proteobacteria bacterium]|nr:twin-arginine translocase subunit TatB [Pseudomonadota bacterium]
MFDIAWTEMLVLLVVAIVVIGPKDLPKVMRTLGVWMRKARGLASEFRFSLDELSREADLDDIRKNAAAAAAFDPNQAIKKALDPSGDMDGLLKPLAPGGGEPGDSKNKDAAKSEAETEAEHKS